MAANRQFPTAGSGSAYMAKIAEEGTKLYDAACLPLTNVAGGTANNPKTSCAPTLSAGLVNYMSFWWTPAADNTGPMTMVVDGNAAVAMVNDAGQPLAAGVVKSGQLYQLSVRAGVIVVTGTVNIQKVNDYQVFTASGTWVKPASCPANAAVRVQLWGGGGGGGTGTVNAVSGGGGGGFVEFQCKAADLASSVSVTIGAGGAVNVGGGATSFGSYASVFGGGRGAAITSSSNRVASGGGGGGAFQAGGSGSANSTGQGNAISVNGGDGGDPTAGTGGGASGSTGNVGTSNPGGWGYFGGGGGGGCTYMFSGSATTAADGGKSVYGGAGGGGRTASGGTSLFGGNGGASGSAGQAPGGGGGSNAVGARGEVRVYVNG